jgi:spore germination protein KA
VVIAYLSDIADRKVVKKIRERIESIDIDGIIDSNYVRAFIEERPMSVFSQSAVSEKPDVVCAKMLEGRVAVIVDGSPMVLTFPFLLIEDFQSGEDYYQRSACSTFLRIVRFLGVMTAIFLPGIYVALQIFHYNIIPMRFVLTLMSSVSGIPFKPLSETVFVILLFELIREAGIRTPRAVGMAMSIVGALVLGETAVKAGIISSPAVMIVALSSLSLYTVPNQVGTMSILRIIFTLLGGAGGLYLIMCGATFMAMYLTSIDSFGTPYLAPFAPINFDDMKDSIARVSMPRMKNRPSSLPNSNARRQK